MTAKEYLSAAYRLNDDINRYIIKRDILKRSLTDTSTALGSLGVQTPQKDRFAEAFSQIADLDQAIDILVDEMVAEKARIAKDIELLGDERLRRILYMRYVGFFPWTDIADAIGVSVRHTWRLHGDALREFSQAVPYL